MSRRSQTLLRSSSAYIPCPVHHLDTLAHFERVADLLAERLVHVRLQRNHLLTVAFADLNHRAGEFRRCLARSHERATTPFHVEHKAIHVFCQFFAHDAGHDERQAGNRRVPPPRNAYSFLSAGAISEVWPIMQQPTFSVIR